MFSIINLNIVLIRTASISVTLATFSSLIINLSGFADPLKLKFYFVKLDIYDLSEIFDVVSILSILRFIFG